VFAPAARLDAAHVIVPVLVPVTEIELIVTLPVLVSVKLKEIVCPAPVNELGLGVAESVQDNCVVKVMLPLTATLASVPALGVPVAVALKPMLAPTSPATVV
jgi:hypothetical protein